MVSVGKPVAAFLPFVANARQKLFIAGGIAPTLAGSLAAGRFRERFEAKGRFSARLATVPTALIVHPFPGLLGAAGCAASLAA